MHYAAQSNDSETVDVFLSYEKKGDIPDNEGRTTLMWAAAKGLLKYSYPIILRSHENQSIGQMWVLGTTFSFIDRGVSVYFK